MYVLLGSGALAAFCRSAEQHFLSEFPLPVLGAVALAEAEGTGASSGTSSIGAGGGVGAAATGVAEGRGGGGSSFLQPVVPAPSNGTSKHKNRGASTWAFFVGFMWLLRARVRTRRGSIHSRPGFPGLAMRRPARVEHAGRGT